MIDGESSLLGLHLGRKGDGDNSPVFYDIGQIASCALEALKIGIVAVEQVVTGEKLIHALDIGDFYANLSWALQEDNGQGVVSEANDMSSLQDEIQGLIDIVDAARKVARRPRGA